MKKVIRMTEADLCQMIEEGVTDMLKNLGGKGFGNFLDGLNLERIGKYAKDRIWHNKGEHEIGEDPDKKDYNAGYKDAKDGKPNRYSQSNTNQQQAYREGNSN